MKLNFGKKINKINAEKHKLFHTMGTGGYKSASPKWDEFEKKPIAAGVTPVTIYFPPKCRSWFFGHGGKLDQKTGEVIIKASLKGADQEILNAMMMLGMGFSSPRERTTSLHAPSRILNIWDEHEA